MGLQWLLLLAALSVLVYFAAQWFVRANPAAMARILRNFAVAAIVFAGLLLVLTGRLPWQTLIAVLVLPLANYFLGRRSGIAGGQSAEPGQTSQVATRFLRMALDHDTGQLDGLVLDGAFAGRALSSMSLEELRSLAAEVSTDRDSLNVLTAYLDRVHGESWRESNGPSGSDGKAASAGAMTREEAYKILGLAPGASEAQIKAAHRKLMKLSHPDHGGSDYLASKINEAKDLLLGC